MGGGEGSTARELLRHKTIEKVVMCDIDQDGKQKNLVFGHNGQQLKLGIPKKYHNSAGNTPWCLCKYKLFRAGIGWRLGIWVWGKHYRQTTLLIGGTTYGFLFLASLFGMDSHNE
ncbi:hypothetical protein POM88_026784 [Heracleum sosnowskyi]|uniref:PABS domain-containing protein n=1 Tax=Heracleum sosnowskyi TaxID=360622 RepID=A0AAD8MKY1_9APIA|nr:hypothetical protein POM88_026784 [Heracleum sosnowskyi]